MKSVIFNFIVIKFKLVFVVLNFYILTNCRFIYLKMTISQTGSTGDLNPWRFVHTLIKINKLSDEVSFMFL